MANLQNEETKQWALWVREEGFKCLYPGAHCIIIHPWTRVITNGCKSLPPLLARSGISWLLCHYIISVFPLCANWLYLANHPSGWNHYVVCTANITTVWLNGVTFSTCKWSVCAQTQQNQTVFLNGWCCPAARWAKYPLGGLIIIQ